MKRDYIRWKSPSLGKEMEMLVFGDQGTPVIVFPTEQGRFYEWEEQGVIEAVREQIEAGYNQLYCLDCVAGECFLNSSADPSTRMVRHTQYLMYILDEVLPFIYKRNPIPFLINTGVGLGAYYSLLLALKYPEHFNKVLGLAGYYNIKLHFNGFYDENVYFNNPVDFITNLNDAEILKSLNNLDIRLLSYTNDPNKEAVGKMSEILWMKFIEHQLYIWNKETGNPWSLIPSMFKEHLI